MSVSPVRALGDVPLASLTASAAVISVENTAKSSIKPCIVSPPGKPSVNRANFVELALFTDGFPGGDTMHGLIDDFAVFSTEITAADAVKLASGTSPSALTGETLIAYWNFNDAPASGAAPTIGVARAGAVLTITYTGILQSTVTIGGQWNDVQGATSPFSVTPASGPASSFYRAKQ